MPSFSLFQPSTVVASSPRSDHSHEHPFTAAARRRATTTLTAARLNKFARLEDAKAARILDGLLEIAGRVIKISAIVDQAGMQDAGVNFADLDDDEGNGLVAPRLQEFQQFRVQESKNSGSAINDRKF